MLAVLLVAVNILVTYRVESRIKNPISKANFRVPKVHLANLTYECPHKANVSTFFFSELSSPRSKLIYKAANVPKFAGLICSA